MTSPAELLQDALVADPARPAVTFYDDATGERVELSVATLDNWVAKTANLLVDGLGATAGGTIGVQLPCHWLAPVWLLAGWAAGQEVLLGSDADAADVLVVGPDRVSAAAAGPAGEVVAVSLRPLGAAFATPLPHRVVDYGAEVLSHGDRFRPPWPVAADDPALRAAGTRANFGELVERGRARSGELGLGSGDRVLTTRALDDLPAVLDGLLAPLAARAGVVLCRHLDPAQLERRLRDERVTLVAGAQETW